MDIPRWSGSPKKVMPSPQIVSDNLSESNSKANAHVLALDRLNFSLKDVKPEAETANTAHKSPLDSLHNISKISSVGMLKSATALPSLSLLPIPAPRCGTHHARKSPHRSVRRGPSLRRSFHGARKSLQVRLPQYLITK